MIWCHLKQNSPKVLFGEKVFSATLTDVDRHVEYFFGYLCYQRLGELAKLTEAEGRRSYGSVFRYGKYAAVAACRTLFEGEESVEKVDKIVNAVLSKWKNFEKHISGLSINNVYFNSYYDPGAKALVREMNFGNYYKGHTIDADLTRYFETARDTLIARVNKKTPKKQR